MTASVSRIYNWQTSYFIHPLSCHLYHRSKSSWWILSGEKKRWNFNNRTGDYWQTLEGSQCYHYTAWDQPASTSITRKHHYCKTWICCQFISSLLMLWSCWIWKRVATLYVLTSEILKLRIKILIFVSRGSSVPASVSKAVMKMNVSLFPYRYFLCDNPCQRGNWWPNLLMKDLPAQ